MAKKIDDQFHDRLERRMEEVGISMRALSLAAGGSETYVRDTLEDRSEPSRDKMIGLARALRCNLQWLITGEGPKEPAATQVGCADGIAGVLAVNEASTPYDASPSAADVAGQFMLDLSREASSPLSRLTLRFRAIEAQAAQGAWTAAIAEAKRLVIDLEEARDNAATRSHPTTNGSPRS